MMKLGNLTKLLRHFMVRHSCGSRNPVWMPPAVGGAGMTCVRLLTGFTLWLAVLPVERAVAEETPSAEEIPCVDVFSQRKYDPAGVTFKRIHNIVYHPEKGLKGDLYLPTGPEPHPVVLFIHGGGWTVGSRRMLNAVLFGEYLACRGYAMFDIDYELAPKNPIPGQIQDCKCALRWLKGKSSELGLDKNRIFVTGGSAGGHLTMVMGTTADIARFNPTCSSYPEEDLRVAGAIPFYGISNMRILLDRGETDLTGGVVQVFMGPGATLEDLDGVSPVFFATPDDPPFLFIHGKADVLAPFGESVRMHEALVKAGASSELKLLDNANHAFDIMFDTEWTRAAIQAMKDFLDRHSGKSSP